MRPAPTAEPVTTVRRLGHAEIAGDIVDHHGSRANRLRNPAAALSVLGPDAGRQAKGRVIGERHCFFGTSDALDGDDWAEGFVLHQAHRVICAYHYGRFEIVWAEIGPTAATG